MQTVTKKIKNFIKIFEYYVRFMLTRMQDYG
jgi:hypothetical protein